MSSEIPVYPVQVRIGDVVVPIRRGGSPVCDDHAVATEIALVDGMWSPSDEMQQQLNVRCGLTIAGHEHERLVLRPRVAVDGVEPNTDVMQGDAVLPLDGSAVSFSLGTPFPASNARMGVKLAARQPYTTLRPDETARVMANLRGEVMRLPPTLVASLPEILLEALSTAVDGRVIVFS
jgi:hypothetical protein